MNDKITIIKRMFYRAYERFFFGFSREDTWSIDNWFCEIMPKMLHYFRLHLHSYPYGMTEKEWSRKLRMMESLFRNANPYIFKTKYDNYSKGINGVKRHGKEVECKASTINADKKSSLIATDKVNLQIDTFDSININAPTIVLNGDETANEKKSIVLQKITEPLALKRLELVNLLKRVKNECESINSEKVSEYKEELDVQPISKVLKK